jgi:protein-disulfide isomerase
MEGRQGQRERLRAQRQREESADAATAQARKRRTQLLVIGAFVAAAAIVAVIILVSQSGSSSNTAPPANVVGVAQVNAELKGLQQSGTVLGDPSSKTTVIEYGDPQCSSCKFFSENVAPDLINNDVRTGKIKYEFRPFLIIGPDSKPAARAALAAGEQNRFWNYLQLFYLNQGGENSGYVTDSFLTGLAKGAAVPDIGKWNTDRNDMAKWNPVIQQGSSQAASFGFSGTPSIVVQGPKGQKALGGSTIPTLQQVEAAIQQVS